MATSRNRGATPHLSRALSHSVPSDYFTQGHSSEDDSNTEMEVEFRESGRRRKASIATDRAVIEDYSKPYQNKSQCLVHSLVERTGAGADQIEKWNYNEENKNETGEDHHGLQDSSTDVSPENGDIRATHSRLLTKKQLSDMALSVRNLAKKLSTLKVKLKIKTIFLLTKAHDKSLIHQTRSVVQWLLSKDRPVEYIVYVENTMRDNAIFDAKGLLENEPSWESRLKYWSNDLARRRPHTFDFVISLGGDGTVLYASWLFQRVVPPVLSFSLGSLGFLTKFDFNKYQETLTKAQQEGVTISLRLRLEGTVMRADPEYAKPDTRDIIEEIVGDEAQDKRTHKPEQTFEILNDIVVDRGPNPTMSTIELFGDDDHLTTVQADGVCVATPTGSTAYNLAAGGSLCHPENPVILVTAICAHTLSFRPVILPDTLVLRMAVPYNARTGSWASFDGRERVELQPGDYVTISASRYPFAHVMPPGRRSEDWINSISRTLQWNSRQRQKPFQEWEDENKKPAK